MRKKEGEDFDTIYNLAKDLLIDQNEGKEEAISKMSDFCTLADIPIKKQILEIMVNDILKKRHNRKPGEQH